MKPDLAILVRAAWVVVAIAAVAPFILSRVQGGGALLRFLRSRSEPILAVDHSALRDEMGAGVRAALFLTIPIIIYGAFFIPGNEGWWLVIILSGAVFVPMLTIPISIAHTVLLRCLAFREPVVSVAVGLVVGTLAGRIIDNGEYAKPLTIYGGVYGVIVAVRHAMLTSRGIGPDEGTPLAEEMAGN
jgi:hypothetical protein